MLDNRDTPADSNDFHVTHAHAHGEALRKTAKKMGVTLVGKMHECKACSMVKGFRMLISSKTSNGEVKCVFVDLGGKKHVKSVRRKTYPMVNRGDYSRYTFM